MQGVYKIEDINNGKRDKIILDTEATEAIKQRLKKEGIYDGKYYQIRGDTN